MENRNQMHLVITIVKRHDTAEFKTGEEKLGKDICYTKTFLLGLGAYVAKSGFDGEAVTAVRQPMHHVVVLVFNCIGTLTNKQEGHDQLHVAERRWQCGFPLWNSRHK